MSITAIPHYDDVFGKGYYLVSEHFDKVWYKGDTAEEAVNNYLKEHYLCPETLTINEVI